MLQDGETLSEADAARLAALHAEVMEGSVLANLGQGTLARYYRFVAGSGDEALFLERREGRIVGAAMLSFRPATLVSRFVRAAPAAFGRETLAAGVRNRAFRRQLAAYVGESLSPGGADLACPELVQLFVDPRWQGKAIGSALIAQAEALLRRRGAGLYCVRTLVQDNDETLAFYRRREFEPLAERDFCGERFVFLGKRLAASGE